MNSYYYTYRMRRKKNHRTLKITIFFFLLCVIPVVWYIKSYHPQTPLPHTQPPHEIPSITTAPISSQVTPLPDTPNSPGLNAVIQNALNGTHGTYGIVVKNLKSDESYQLNQDMQFETASLYKLWVMAIVYQRIQARILTQNQVLSEDASALNATFQIDSDSADQTDGTVTFTVNDALYKMITISDNEAALLLTEKIGLSSIVSFLKTNGFSNSTVGKNGNAPTSTARDIALFFEKLYSGQLANQAYTEEMISLLKRQALNSKIPKYLPDSIIVAHKTGELDSYTHDAGIIYTPRGDYLLVVLTNSDDPLSADERISEVSRDVYNYFSQ